MNARIRPVRHDDADRLSAIYAPYVSHAATSFEAEPPDGAEFIRRIDAQTSQYPWLVAELDDEVVGYAYAASHRARYAYRWSVEVTVYIAAAAHHRGVGRALYTALFDLLRLQGYVNAFAGITLPNPASIAIHHAMGFTDIGVFRRIGFKFGTWHDVAWLQLRLADAETPAELRPADGLIRDPAIDQIFTAAARGIRANRSRLA